MSTSRSAWRYLGLLVIAALAVGVFAGPASAKKLNKQQRAKITKQLRKEIKKNPKAINRKSFLRRAALVNFRLPITVRLRTGDIPSTAGNEAATRNTNRASLDLGASLGQRELNLGGNLAGEIVFADSYDGGALGNVQVDLTPTGATGRPKFLTTTSIPLLWNERVSSASTRWDASALAGSPAMPQPALAGLEAARGCGNFKSTTAGGNYNSPLPPGKGAYNPGDPGGYLTFGAGYVGPDADANSIPDGLPGYPLYATAASPTPSAYIGQRVGAEAIDALKANRDPANPNSLGGNPSPFPASPSGPGSFAGSGGQPTLEDTVLRTAPLQLRIANPGTAVRNDGFNPDGVQGGANITMGKSGGMANLFGNIPGRSYGIDVTVNLETKINSIYRIVEQDSWGRNLISGEPWPAGVFECRQTYSGWVQNYIPGVRLQGSLRIAPGITSDGNLRIAKAKLSTGTQEKARFAVAACLMPYASFAAENGAAYAAPLPAAAPGKPTGQITEANLPVDLDAIRPTPQGAGDTCNADPTALVKNSALAASTVDPLGAAASANGYSVTNSGSVASVAADLDVNNVDADILIGDV